METSIGTSILAPAPNPVFTMSWKPYKPVVEISADWVFRGLIAVCVYFVMDIRSDLKEIQKSSNAVAAQVLVNETKIAILQRDVDRMEHQLGR